MKKKTLAKILLSSFFTIIAFNAYMGNSNIAYAVDPPKAVDFPKVFLRLGPNAPRPSPNAPRPSPNAPRPLPNAPHPLPNAPHPLPNPPSVTSLNIPPTNIRKPTYVYDGHTIYNIVTGHGVAIRVR